MADERSSWAVGYAFFAAVMLMIVGIFQAVIGIVGLVKDEFFVLTDEWVFEFDTTAWGWIHVIWALVLIAAGLSILKGNLYGRIIGIIAAGLSAVVNFMWLPYYPVWSALIIALNVAIIWALSVHGRDIAMDK